MVKKKRKKKKKVLGMPKISGNETYWLSVTRSKKDIEAFAERGNPRQKKTLKQAIAYRQWQIQEEAIDPNFWEKVGIEIQFLKIDVDAPPKPKRKIVVDGYIRDEDTTIEKEKLMDKTKVLDLFDIANIDLEKE